MRHSSPLKNILKTSLPAVVDLSSQTIMFTIEAILIGRISTGAFAGQGLAIQVVIAFLTILITFIVGSSLIVARHVGAEEKREANHVFGQAVMISFVISMIFAVVWYFGGVHLFKLIEEGGSSEARQAGTSYLRIVALFAPIIITNFTAVGIIRGAGDTHLSMIVNVAINGLNVILAPLLIFGWFGFPRWEVQGAAMALGISHSAGFLVTFYILRTRKSVLFLSLRELTRPNFQTFKRLLKAGVPTTIEQMVWAVGALIVSIYAAQLGGEYLAAHIVLSRIQSILSMAYLGFSLTAMTLMGKNLGAEKRKLAEKTARTAGWVGFVFSFAIALLMIAFSKSILYFFTPEEAVIAIGINAMIVFAILQVPKAVGNVVIGNLRGAGDLKWIMYITIVGVVLFEIGLNWIIAFSTSLAVTGLWLVHFLDETVRLAVNYWRFKGGRWKLTRI
ncbi:MATE family efflux transporter [candidate division KSB1 bacterium]|nr:MATE family efflux transporter [candidate division KSB1 bacterium]